MMYFLDIMLLFFQKGKLRSTIAEVATGDFYLYFVAD